MLNFYIKFWKLTRGTRSIFSILDTRTKFYFNRCNVAHVARSVCISYFELLYYNVSERRQLRMLLRHGIICPAHLCTRCRTEGQAVQLSMQRLARLYIVMITSFQVFTTTRRHRTHLYLFSRLASCIRMHVLRYATYLHFDFAPRSGIGNVETGEPLPRYNVSSTYNDILHVHILEVLFLRVVMWM